MKVIESNELKTVRFDTVEIGTVIKFEGEIFMKLSPISINGSNKCNAVSFERNRVFGFDNELMVSKLENATLTY